MKWSQTAYQNLRVLPPGLGICHQVNLEYLSEVAFVREEGGQTVVFPDSVLGTDSHTTMVNGLGVLGWGVGGIEALAAMLGYPSEFAIPEVVGVELTGSLPVGTTPTDLTLTLTSRLRALGVVNKFVEVFGAGCADLPVETRAMMANMSPESGATATYFPVDAQTLDYLGRTGRPEAHIQLVEAYYQAQGLFREKDSHPEFTQILQVNLNEIQPVMAGPKRPQDIFLLKDAKQVFDKALITEKGNLGFGLSASEAAKKATVSIKSQRLRIDPQLGINRCHHFLHQHLRSGCIDHSRAAGAESRFKRTAFQTLGENQFRARLPCGKNLLGCRRVDGRAGSAGLSYRGLRLHDLHWQLRAD